MVPEASPAGSASSTDTDSASEASYDLNTLAPVPPENPGMYKLCYGGSSSSVDSQRSNRPDLLPAGGMTTVVTSSQTSLDSIQSNASIGSLTSRKIDRKQAPPISSPSSTDSGVHLPVTSPTNSGLPPRPPMIPLGQMTVQQAQQQKLQSQLTGKLMIQSAKEAFLGGAAGGSSDTPIGAEGGSQVTPVSSPTTLSQRVELMSQRSPMSPQSPLGIYPEQYNTLQRRTRIQAGWDSEKRRTDGDLPDTAQLLMSPTQQQPSRRDVSPQDRQQLFQDYVNTLQSQAPQAYSSIGGLADYCNGRQSALTREQRAEILDLMRRSKHNRPATSPVEIKSNPNDPTSPTSTASFRSSYHEGIESAHLDPDMAIIRAAEQLEQNRTEIITSPVSLLPLKTNLTSPEGDLPFLGPTPTGSPKIIPDEPRTPLYIFDPNRQPKNGILKAKKSAKKPAKSKGKSDELEARIHAAKKKMNITTDPFANQGRPMSPSESSSDSSTSLNSRCITFSDTVHVDSMPMKVCSVSGKPKTSIDDFKALLQTRQKTFRPFNAAERLSSSSATPQPLPKSRLDEMLETEVDAPGTPERRIVTVYDLRNAMANARSSTRTNDLRLPYQQLQSLKQKSPSSSPDGTLSKEDLAKGAAGDLDKDEDTSVKGKKSGLRETDLRFLSPDDGKDDPQIQEIMDKMDEDEKEQLKKMEKAQQLKTEVLKIEEPKHQTVIMKEIKGAASTESEDTCDSDDTLDAKQLVSPHDDPTRKKLLESIRERGQRKDSRQEAIKMLEALKTIHEKPELTIEVPTPTDGTITTLLDNMKTQIPHRYPTEMPTSPNSSEHEYGSDAWD